MTEQVRRRFRRLLRALITLFTYDVFISYARDDGRRYARNLQRRLEASGLITYLDTSDMEAGNELDSSLAASLRRSRLVALIATDGARVSPYVNREIEVFLKKKRPIVPLNFDGSYTSAAWPHLGSTSLVWVDESSDALEAGVPGRHVISALRRQLGSAGARSIVKRFIVAGTLLLVVLVGGVIWTAMLAGEQGRARDAQRLAARAQLAFDVDQNPLLTIAYGVASLRQHDSLEATDAIARSLPFVRKHLGGTKIGGNATWVWFSPTGRYLLAIGSPDAPTSQRVAVVIEAADMKEKLRVQRKGFYLEAAIRRSEDVLALADQGKCVSIISIQDGQEKKCLEQPGATHVAFSPDGRFLSIAGPEASQQEIRVWDATSWNQIAKIEFPRFLRSMAFSLSGNELLISVQAQGTSEGSACLWDFRASEVCRFASTPVGESVGYYSGREARNVRIDGNGRSWLASSAVTASVTEIGSGEARRSQSLVSTPTIAPAGSDNVPALITTPSGGIATLWRSEGVVGHLVHGSDVNDVRFSPDAGTIVTTAGDGIVRLWDSGLTNPRNDFTGSNRLAAFLTHGLAISGSRQNPAEAIVGIAVSPDSRSFATAGNDGWVRRWELHAEPDNERGRHGQWVAGAVATKSPNRFVTASDYAARVWELNPLREITQLRRHENDNRGVYISDDGSLIATSGDDGCVMLFDDSYRYLRPICHDKSESPIAAALAGTGRRLLTGRAGTLRLWDTGNSALLGELKSDSAIGAIAINPGGTVAAVGTGKSVLIVDAGDRLTRREERAGDSPVTMLRFDRSGNRLVIGHEDGSIRYTDAATGRDLWKFGHVGRVSASAFSPDNRYLLTGSQDRTARVWDLDTGIEMARQSRSFGVDAVTFLDGGRLVLAAGQNYLQISRWRRDDLIAMACDQLKALKGESWKRVIGDELAIDICGPPGQ